MNRSLQTGVFLLNAFVLAMEIAITRIFSVTMFYHFAFLAVSVALFGFGASGVVLYIWRKRFGTGDLGYRLGNLSFYAGMTAVGALLVSLSIQFNPHTPNAHQFVKLLGIYLATSVPFFFAGMVLALVFQRLSRHIARLYFLSLAGSALGAILIIPLLQLAGGPGSVLVTAGIGFLSMTAFYFGSRGDSENGKPVWRKSVIARYCPALLALSFIVAGFLNPFIPVVRITYAKGYHVDPDRILFDEWNAFSRIIVLRARDDNALGNYQGGIYNWGISEEWRLDENEFPDQLWLEIDNTAGTPITKFEGDPETLDLARYDVTAAAYYLLNDPHVLVIGPGGGKDLLAALAFDASKVEGAEINPLIGEAMRENFADYNGNIYDYGPIDVTVSEGRTYIARSTEKYDLIQISLIDTWAAASTGAYALSENNLYTVEAFEQYFKHLGPDGIFSMSRFSFDPPRETLKVVSVARAALERQGVEDPSQCVIVIRQGVIANVMVRPDGFDGEAIASISEVVDDLDFEILYMPDREPQSEGESVYHDLLTTSDFENFTEQYPLDIRPTNDNRPFFFYLLPPWDFIEALQFGKSYRAGYNSIAIFTLVSLLLISVGMVIIFIILPLLLLRRIDIRERSGPKLRMLSYFVCLGLAFIMIEIALMQDFTLFLGYPVYSLVAVLTSLLLFSGLGSSWSGRVPDVALEVGIGRAIIGICIVAIIYIFALPPIFRSLIGLPDWSRILITVVLVFPLGWFMGQPFPLALRMVEREGLGVIAWAWGVNGAASVLGSALALTVAIGVGYKLTLFAGVAIYLVGWAIIATVRKLRGARADEIVDMSEGIV